jgi:hypothetical protein
MDFSVHGAVETSRGSYAILMDEAVTMYFPIQCSPFHSQLVAAILSNEAPFDIECLGIYFSMLSMFRAHDMFPTQMMLTVGKSGKTTCELEVSEENELGSKISRVPLLLPDAIVLAVLCKIPVVVYGTAGTDFTFKIDKSVPKDNVFSCICEEIAKSERLSAISSEDGA